MYCTYGTYHAPVVFVRNCTVALNTLVGSTVRYNFVCTCTILIICIYGIVPYILAFPFDFEQRMGYQPVKYLIFKKALLSTKRESTRIKIFSSAFTYIFPKWVNFCSVYLLYLIQR